MNAHYQHITNVLRNTMAVFVALFWAFACTDTPGYDQPVPPVAGDGKINVRFSLMAPGAQQRSSAVRSAGESTISEVKVLVFEDDVFLYYADIQEIPSGETSPMTINAGVIPTPNQVRICVIVNANSLLDEVVGDQRMLFSDMRRALVSRFNSSETFEYLPMFGFCKFDNGLTSGADLNAGAIKLLRPVAAIDVSKHEDVGNFTLESVQVFRASNKYQLIPNNWTIEEGAVVMKKPSIPQNTQRNARSAVVSQFTGDELQVYIPESSAVSSEADLNKATCIVVGGKYTDGNGTSPTTYYRIDFKLGGNIAPVLRNHRYKFQITGVSRNGEPTPEDAANADKTAITATVTQWEERYIDIAFQGENYFGISDRQVSIPFRVNATDRLDVFTSVTGFTVQWCDENGEPLAGTTPSELIEDEFFKVQIAEDKSSITVTSLTENRSNNTRTGYFVIHADTWKIPIQISQASTSIFRNQYVNILSFGRGIGCFGSTFPGHINAGDASAIRGMLDNTDNFGPDGIVPIGNLNYDYIDESNNEESLRAYLKGFDLINIAWAADDLSEMEARLVVEWLDASPHRVLMLTVDNDVKNKTTWNTLYPQPDAGSVWDNSSSITGGASFYGYTPDNDYFTASGPFGAVNPEPHSFYVRIADSVWMGIDPNHPFAARLTPLLVRTDDSGYYVISVDKERRVIYNGDSSMYQYRANGWNRTGVIDNDRQRLLGNLFAWAIEEIIMPGKTE